MAEDYPKTLLELERRFATDEQWPCLSGGTPLAGGICLWKLWRAQSLGRATRSVHLRGLPASNNRERWHDFPR
jgi:hypothetical protein